LGSGKRRDCAAEGVSCHTHAVRWMLFYRVFHCGDDSISCINPRLPESRVRTASVADVGGGEPEVEVSEPVVQTLGAAEGYDD